MVLALVLFGCSDIRLRSGDDDDDAAPPVDPPVGPTLDLTAAAAFDPLAGPLALDVVTDPSAAVTLEIRDGDRVVVTEIGTADADGHWSTRWDGRKADGWRQAGVYTVTASIPGTASGAGADDQATVGLVRAGFVAVRLEGDDGVSATREPLYWPVAGELQDVGQPVTTLAAIDDGITPLDFPPVPDGPMALRPAGNEPAAFVFDSRPILALDVATSSALGKTGLDAVDVTVAADGWTVLSGVPLRPGEEVLLQRDEPLGDTVGVSVVDVDLRFSAVDGTPLGHQTVPLTLYRLLAASQFEDPADRYRSWAPVVAQALAAIDGTPADTNSVLDALVDFVYFDLGLSYDTQSGAAVYSDYRGFDFSGPHFFLGDFLTRRNGSVINCSDAGNILGAYANMVGARLDHLILDPGFQLNFIQAIGATEHTSCPFGPGGCGFNYHAVTTTPDSGLIWDATLALDGDADPGNAPNVDLMVQQIPAAEYFDRLVRSGNPSYNNQTQETLE